ncbi:MAG TPA: copper resistance CopC family protein [Ornithinicoccus sp.]|nr:copper resistance CopC family protein [Ornithinicoccus sp.]
MFSLTGGGRRPGGRVALGSILLALWLTLLAVPASAHDTLIDSEPAQDDVLTQVPDGIVLTFSGEISELGVQFMVTGPEGRDVVQGTPDVQGTVVTQGLADELVDGAYEAVWRVTSSDGHPISGTINFMIEAGNTAGQGASPQESTSDAAAPTEDASAPTATETARESRTDPAAVTADAQALGTGTAAPSDGIPGWGWLVAALAAAGLVACGFLAFRRI